MWLYPGSALSAIVGAEGADQGKSHAGVFSWCSAGAAMGRKSSR